MTQPLQEGDSLDKFLTATFDSSGIARILANPDRAREHWKVSRYQCNTTSASSTKLTVYRGSERAGTRIDYTARGNNDVSDNFKPIGIPPHGQPLLFVWTGGTPGATAEITILGELLVK